MPEFKLYHYDPSAGCAVAFAAVFGLTTVVHIWQLGRNRTWYFIPFVIGGLCVSYFYIFPINFETMLIA